MPDTKVIIASPSNYRASIFTYPNYTQPPFMSFPDPFWGTDGAISGARMFNIISSSEFTNSDDFYTQNAGYNYEYDANAHISMPSFGFVRATGLPTVLEVSNKLDAFLEEPGPLITNAFAPPIRDDNKTPPPLAALQCYSPVIDDIPFHVKTKTIFICTYRNCNKEFGRKPELYRHHRSVHKAERPYKCRDTGCLRAFRGFPRTDKRDDHERKVHKLHQARGSWANMM
jgi:hypothetical protein